MGLMEACVRLTRGEVLQGPLVSAGRWTPAVADGFTWAVIDLRGAPLWLGHDAFECAVAFIAYREYDADDVAELVAHPRREPTDEQAAADALYERWCDSYRWRGLPFPKSLEAFGYAEVCA